MKKNLLKFHIILPRFLQFLNFQSSVSWQVLCIIDVLHGTKWCLDYVHPLFNPHLVHDVLSQPIRPFSKRFGSHLYHTLPVCFRLVPLFSQVWIDQRRMVILLRIALSRCLNRKQDHIRVRMRSGRRFRRVSMSCRVKCRAHFCTHPVKTSTPLVRTLLKLDFPVRFK